MPFPPACPADTTLLPRKSWTIPTLSYLEQGNVQNLYDLTTNWDSATNLPRDIATIKVFQCPSAPTNRLDGDPQNSTFHIVSTTDYAAVTGVAAYATTVNTTVRFARHVAKEHDRRIGDTRPTVCRTP